MKAKHTNQTTYPDDLTDPFSRYLLESYAPIILFLNKSLDILYTNGNLEGFLQIPKALVRANAYKMMDRKTAMVFEDGVRLALSSSKVYEYKEINFSSEQEEKIADLKFQRVDLAAVDKLMVMVEIQPLKSKDKKVKQVAKISKEDLINHRIQYLENSLVEKEQQMQLLVSKLEVTNEELESSNRELLANNEELQSTNEELQSVNEELYTVNTELKLKHEEVTLTYNDLNNLLRSTNIGTIFLDNNLKIRKFTPAVRYHFDLVETDIDRSITSFSHHLKGINLAETCRNVFDKLKVFEQEVKDKTGKVFLLRILPYRTEDGKIEGLVITFIEIEELAKTRAAAYDEAVKFKAIFNNAPSSLIFTNTDGKIVLVNKTFGDYSIDELPGQNIFSLLPKKVAKTLESKFKTLVENGTSDFFSMTLPMKNSKTYHFKVDLIPILGEQSNKVSRVCLSINDVSEDIANVEQLKKSKEKYLSFMENARHQIALIDKEGIIQEVNYTRYSGKTRVELKGTSVYDELPKSEVAPYKKAIAKIFSGGSHSEITFKYINKDKEEMNVTLIASPVIINDKIEYVALIGHPIGD